MAHTQDPKPPTLLGVIGISPRWIVIGLLLLVLAFVGWHYGSKYYNEQQKIHLITQGREFEAKGDLRSAALTVRRVLQLDPENLEAVRLMADLADNYNTPVVLQWMQRLNELEPDNVTNLVRWTRSALRLGELTIADQVLGKFPKKAQAGVEFHRLAGAIAIQARAYQAAEYHFAQVLKLNPDNPPDQLNLAAIRLLSSKPELVKKSRETLEKLMQDPKLGVEAGRSLLSDATRRGNNGEQIKLSEQIMHLPGAQFYDRLSFLDALRRARSKRFNEELENTMKMVAGNKDTVAELGAWMNSRDYSPQVIPWLEKLPAVITKTPAVALVIAEARVNQKQWDKLLELTSKANWEELNFLRYAFLARAQRELNVWGPSVNSWRQALSTAGIAAQNRALLARLAQGWGWNTEAIEIWWALARGQTGQLPALKALHKIYLDTGDSRNLLRVTEKIMTELPGDPVIRNNYAMLSFLLGQNLIQARQIARENYEKYPNDPTSISTYAFSLRESGELDQALDVMRKLPAELIKRPDMAAYIGVFLTEAGKLKEAKEYLKLAQSAKDLLPEERELVKAALQKQEK